MRDEVTETERAILEVLWERGAVPVREIVEAIYGSHSHSLHSGVKSLLERLMEKGYVERDTEHFAHRFHACVDRAAFVGGELERLLGEHFNGAVSPMLQALVDHVRLSNADRAAIRRIIGEIEG